MNQKTAHLFPNYVSTSIPVEPKPYMNPEQAPVKVEESQLNKPNLRKMNKKLKTRINTDPQFKEWDGNTNTLASWILDAAYRVETQGTSDYAAIRFVKMKLSALLKNSTLTRGGGPVTRKAFTELSREHFYGELGYSSKYEPGERRNYHAKQQRAMLPK